MASLAFPMACVPVNVSVSVAATVADGSPDRTMVVEVTDDTEFGVVVSRSAPYAPIPTVTPAVIGLLVQVRVAEDVVPVQPVRLTTGLFPNAPNPAATVGAPAAKAGAAATTAMAPSPVNALTTRMRLPTRRRMRCPVTPAALSTRATSRPCSGTDRLPHPLPMFESPVTPSPECHRLASGNRRVAYHDNHTNGCWGTF